jgi:hypothetical protein
MQAQTPCFECSAPADHEHHVVPRSLGGVRTVALCDGCHGRVHGLDFTDHGVITKAALASKRARGERTSRHAPYGYQLAADGVHLEPNPAEQSVITRVRALEPGRSCQAIADALAAKGIVTAPATHSRGRRST